MELTDQVVVARGDLAALLDPTRSPLWPSSAYTAAAARLRSAAEAPVAPIPWADLEPWLGRLLHNRATLGTGATARLEGVQAGLRMAMAAMGVDITSPAGCHQALALLRHTHGFAEAGTAPYVLALAAAAWVPPEDRR